MEPHIVAWNIVLVIFFTLLNGFFVTAEFAMVKVRSSRLRQLEGEGRIQARMARHVGEHLDAYLSACQLGITLASLALGALGEPAVAQLIEPSLKGAGLSDEVVHSVAFAIAFSIITVLHIVFGELAPKSIAIQRAESAALATAGPLRLFHWLFYPAIVLLNGMANRTLKAIGIEPVGEHESAHTEDEIRILMRESAKHGSINQQEAALFERLFKFSDRRVREVMVPRVDMVCLDVSEPFDEMVKLALDAEKTRYPICDGSKDKILGFVHVRDILARKADNLEALKREPMFIPESVEISAVLREMQRRRVHMAIVVDEFGGTAGLVALDDILEEIVGEIRDEFDHERPSIERVGDGTFSVDGRLMVDDLVGAFDLEIETDAESVGGWLSGQLGHVPAVGDSVVHDGVEFTVEVIDGRRAQRILVKNARVREGTAELSI